MAAGELWESVEEPDSIDSTNEPGPSGDRDADVDTVRLYFHQIGRVPLLKPHEEYALCQRIEAARSAVAAALLAVPKNADRVAQALPPRGGAADVAGLLLSPEGRPLHKAEIVDAFDGAGCCSAWCPAERISRVGVRLPAAEIRLAREIPRPRTAALGNGFLNSP